MSTETTKSNSPSYSYCTEVTDPSRFLVDLPLLQEETEDLIESNLTTQQNFISGGSSSPPPSSTSTRTRRMSSPRGSTVSPLPNGNSTVMSNSGPSFPLSSSSSSSASSSTVTDSPNRQRSSSKSRKRLSVTLSGLLNKGRSRSASKSGKDERGEEQRSVSMGMNETGESGRSSVSSSRRPSVDDTNASSSRSPSPPPTLPLPHEVSTPSSSNKSKPPVSLPSLFRRRPSNSSITSPTSPSFPQNNESVNSRSTSSFDGSRQSIERHRLNPAGLGLSSSSIGSSDGGLLSDGSTAATSPDIDSAEVTTPRPLDGLSSADKRRRSSLVLAQELGSQTNGEEDLAAFVRASGSTSPSPNLTSGPFARRPSNPYTFSPSSNVFLDSPSISQVSTTPPVAPETADSTIAARRQTRNIENLNLGDLGRRSPVPPTAGSTADDDEPNELQSVSSSSPPALSPGLQPTRPRSTTQARLQALPRLLSMDAIPSYGTALEEEEQEPDEETESDNEDLDGEGEGETEGEGEGETTAEATSEDEGDQYASADEGPSISRSTTPAQTPRPASRPASHDRLASSASSSSSRGVPPRIPSLTGLAMFANGSPALGGGRGGNASSWVTFAPATPGTVRTARPLPPSTNSADQSYFDLPRPSASGSKTPGGVPQTPLAPMSISDVARGKRPALQEDAEEAEASHARLASTPGLMQTTPAASEDSAVRHGLYRLRSQSEVALMSPSMVDSDDEPVGTAAITGLDSVWRTGGLQTPGPSFLSKPSSPISKSTSPRPSLPPLDIPGTPGPPPTPLSLVTPSSPIPSSPTQTRLSARPTTGNARLHRPRSMYELRDAPPDYTSIARQPGFGPRQNVQPREEEGKEGLPQYTCSIHIEGFMPRKMEFTAPGTQAKDRAWKRQYVVLHGTSIKVYKYDLRTHPIPGEEDWSTVPVDIYGNDGPPPLHFHQGEYGVDNSQGSRFPLSIEDAKAKAKSRIIQQATASSTNQLLRHYSLQNAESGLAADYIKRKHVVRVRAEGEQFLLQAKDDRGVIDLIEALQAATNVALDLDARPLPKFITLPRRRRRRRPRQDAAAAAMAAATAAAIEESAAAAGVPPPAESRRRSPDRFADMADEDRALATGNEATLG